MLPHCILSRKHKEYDDNSPSKFYVLVNCVTVTANTYLVSLNENSILSSKMIYKSIPKVTTASIFPSANHFLSELGYKQNH